MAAIRADLPGQSDRSRIKTLHIGILGILAITLLHSMLVQLHVAVRLHAVAFQAAQNTGQGAAVERENRPARRCLTNKIWYIGTYAGNTGHLRLAVAIETQG